MFNVSNVLVAPSPPRSGNSRRLRLGLRSRVVSALVWKVAPSPHWSKKSRRLLLGLQSHAASALVARNDFLVAPSLPRSGMSRRLRLGLKSRAVSASTAKTHRLHLGRESLESAHFGRAGQAGRAVAFEVAPFPASHHIHHSHESRAVSTSVEKSLKNFFKVAPSPCWSGKSRRLHLVLESLEIGRFGRTGHAISWPAGSRHIRLGRESRALVFRSRKSGNGNSWSRESGHTNYESRCFMVAKVWKCHVLIAKAWTCLISVWKVWTCQNFVAKVWTWVWDLDPGRPLKTTYKPLKPCLKNRSKITAKNERFLSGF